MGEESDRFGAVVHAAGPEVGEALLALDQATPDNGPRPLFNEESLAAAVVDRHGRVIASSPAFAALEADLSLDTELLDRVASGRGGRTTLHGVVNGDATETTLCAYAPASGVDRWILPRQVRAAAAASPEAVVVLTSQSHRAERPLEAACSAFGLSGLQTRVALAAVRTGSVRTAARRLGISYDTAREAIAEAMERARAPRLAALVHRLVSLAFGVLPQADGGDVLGDAWGLSARQAAIAALIADGMTRIDVAGALGLSDAVVQKELKEVYRLLDVGSAAALARKVAEANALGWMTRSTAGDIGLIEAGAEPLRFVHRPDGRRIAVSDYGPASGRAVLVVHSSMTSRVVARSLRRALQAAGYRPISIDRPGFGLTDEVAGLRAGAHDPYAAAAVDALLVLDALKLEAIDVVARGGAQFAVALHQVAPSRLRRVVLVNPDPPSEVSGDGAGPFGAIKTAFLRNPAMIRIWAGVIGRQLTHERLSQMMERWMRGSPPDEAAARDPDLVDDYFRAVRTFATGRHAGYVNEQVHFAQRGLHVPAVAGTSDWRVLVAGHDTLHDPDRVLDYWRTVLPDARFQRVPDSGRFLALTHPQEVINALR